MNLSKNFTLEEFLYSETANKEKIVNAIDDLSIENLKILVSNLLQPVRDLWGKPLKISSGFRTSLLNTAVGGSDTSDHMKGKAADCMPGPLEAKKLYEMVIKSGLDFDQAILYTRQNFVHLSFREGNNRKQSFINN